VEGYLAELEGVSGRPVVYVDGTGIDACLCREHGRSARGEAVIGKTSGRKFKRVGLVAGQTGKSIVAPMQYDGTMDSGVFEWWFDAWLLPALPEGSVVVMDNASFHRKGRLHALAERAGHSLLFLPPYSPELNPIEHFWAWLKGRLRKILPQFSSFDEALHEAFQVN
jgi:transposase